jgi:hypothetical protein
LIGKIMTERPISLDLHRGMAAQKATELRRLLAEVAADQEALKGRQRALEAQLISAPAATWAEAVDKARYLLKQFAATPAAQDPRRRRLIASVLEDFGRLSAADAARTGQLGVSDHFAVRRFEEDVAVANREQRSNREKRKPKAKKPKAPAQVSPFANPQAAGNCKGDSGKKAR